MRDARAFCAVVDAGSVTAAAKLLGETKGSISRRVARLEQALGVALLRRSPRLVQPTEHGAAYRTKVGQALELFDQAADSVDGDRPSGLLRVTTPGDFAIGLMPELSARFVERHPDVQLELVVSDDRLDFDALRIDCALRVGTHRDSNLRVHKLLDLEIGFFASPAYLARAGTPERPSDLTKLRFIAYTNMERPLEVTFERREQRQSVALEPSIIGDSGFVHAVIAENGGFGGMPKVLAERALAAGRIVALLPGWRLGFTRALSLLYPSGTYVPAKVRAFRDFVAEHFAGHAKPPKGRAVSVRGAS
jgi:DNA-binding transcriptional LysR family regulator